MNYTKKNILIISSTVLISTLGFSQTETKRATSIRQIMPSKVEMTYSKAVIVDNKQNNILEEDKANLDNIIKVNTAANTKQLVPSNLITVAIPVNKKTSSKTNKPIQKGTSKASRFRTFTTMTFEKAKD